MATVLRPAAHAADGIPGGGLTALSSKNSERLEQRLCRDEVGGVEPLGEAPVDRGQQLPRLARLALSLPKPCDAHRRPELPGQRSLAAGELQRLLEVILRNHGSVARREHQDELAL